MCNDYAAHIVSSVSPPAFQLPLSSIADASSVWDGKLLRTDSEVCKDRRSSRGERSHSSAQQFEQIAFTGAGSPLEINDLLHVQDAIIPWPKNSPHSSAITSQEATLHSTPSLVNPIEDGSYPSPAETDSDFRDKQPYYRGLNGKLLHRTARSLSILSHIQSNGSGSNAQSPLGESDYPGIPIDFLLDKPGDHEKDRALDISTSERKWHAYLNSVTDNYGLDRGRPDLDLNKNNDHAAIDVNHALQLINSHWKCRRGFESVESETSFVQQDNLDLKKRTYYISPVPVDIPRYLSPLPATLLKNPINLMYFHHFLNHTAKMLVPHDCEDNPFVSVLPSSK